MPGAVLDESVSLLDDEPRLLVTRDAHFTNPFRFPPDRTGGILYIARGNLLAAQEADLVVGFLKNHPADHYRGRLVSLTPGGSRVR